MLVKNALSYSLVNTYAQITRFIQEIVIRFILPPSIMGLWSLAIVVQNFGLSLDWGILTAAIRKLPLLYGKKQYKEAANYRITVFYLHLLGKILVSTGIIIYGLIRYTHPFKISLLLIIAAALIIIVSSFGETFIALYQSKEDFVVLSKKLFIYWTCYPIALISGAYFFAIPGLVIATLLTLALQGFLLRKSLDKSDNSSKFEPKMAKQILQFALPFRLADLPMSVALVLDSLFVAHFLGLQALAIYATAKLIFNQAGQIPTWIGRIFIVRITTMAGEEKTRRQLGNAMLMNINLLYLIILPIIISIIAIVTYWGIVLFLPKYVKTITLVPILLIALYFLPRVTIIRNIWLIDKNFRLLAISNVIGASFMLAGLSTLYLTHTLSLLTAATIFTLSFGCYFLFIISHIGKALWGVKRLIPVLFELFFAIIMLLIAMYYAGLFYQPSTKIPFLTQILESILRLYLFIIPIVFYGIWQLNIITHLKQKLIK